MAHHPADLFLRVLPDIRSLWDAPADHFMVVLTVRLLIGGVRIAVKHTRPWISLPVTFDRPGVGKLAAVVRQLPSSCFTFSGPEGRDATSLV